MTFCRPTDLLPSVAKVPAGRVNPCAPPRQTETIALAGGALSHHEMANGGVGEHPTSNDCKAGGNVCFIARPHPGPLPRGEGEKVAAFGNNQAGEFAERVGEWSKCVGKKHRTSNIERPKSNAGNESATALRLKAGSGCGPRVARASQPRALGRNPVGMLGGATVELRFPVKPCFYAGFSKNIIDFPSVDLIVSCCG